MLPIIHCSTIPKRPGWRHLDVSYAYKWNRVPAGFTFNGASTPWLARGIIPKFHYTLEASCVHDWLCNKAKSKDDRKEADIIFKEMLREKGMGKFRSTLGFWGVRIGAFFTRY